MTDNLDARQKERDRALCDLAATSAVCDLCDTPIRRTDAGWRHNLGLVDRCYCQLPTPPEPPPVLGDVMPLDCQIDLAAKHKPGGCTTCGDAA